MNARVNGGGSWIDWNGSEFLGNACSNSRLGFLNGKSLNAYQDHGLKIRTYAKLTDKERTKFLPCFQSRRSKRTYMLLQYWNSDRSRSTTLSLVHLINLRCNCRGGDLAPSVRKYRIPILPSPSHVRWVGQWMFDRWRSERPKGGLCPFILFFLWEIGERGRIGSVPYWGMSNEFRARSNMQCLSAELSTAIECMVNNMACIEDSRVMSSS